MMENDVYDIIIIGGGLAGLVNAICLSRAGYKVLVIEKKVYPYHKVCGEYVSNEVLPFLQRIDADPMVLKPAKIERLSVSSPSGNTLEIPLLMGGFGVSRFKLDEFLFERARNSGAEFLLNTQANDVKEINGVFHITTDTEILNAKLAIGSFGKRSNLDRTLERPFFYKRSPYIGVKYHIKRNIPEDLISLHNFKDGYCGISRIEDEKTCLCYMTTRENLKEQGSIEGLEKNILSRNPFLKDIFSNSEFLFDKPETINEISFEKKGAVTNHILMSGDSAGMITPLCGNGMAMAIHSAKILSDIIIKNGNLGSFKKEIIETEYAKEWNKVFEKRISIGRQIQKMFGKESVTELSISMLKRSSMLTKWLVKQTHGKPF